ncbi:MAG: serine/threonine-protein kinase [Pseudomonadota bacterium]
MAGDPRFDQLLQTFLKGRSSFDVLVNECQTLAQGAEMQEAFRASLGVWVARGQFPDGLAQLLEQQVLQQSASGAGALEPDDLPTVPQQRGAPPSEPPSALPERDSLTDKVDEVVLSALVSNFQRFRQEAPTTERQEGDRALDGLLSGFQSARIRRNARKAASGQAAAFSLEDAEADRRDLPEPDVGTMLKDRFVLDRELGRGGMGKVFAAVDRRRLEAMHSQPYVAIKLVNAVFQRNPFALQTLEAEARKAQALAHPNIITVHDFDRDGGAIFLVMELLEGRPLTVQINAAAGEGMMLDDIAPVVNGMLDGLAYAHERGVVHADLKPGNIFCLNNGGVKLIDFGIASARFVPGFDAADLNAFSGPYASLEMVEGLPRDPRDDIYALGCILYLMLAGRHPFDRRPASEARDLGLEPIRPEHVSGRAWSAITDALAFDRDKRIGSVEEVRKGLFGGASSGWFGLKKR